MRVAWSAGVGEKVYNFKWMENQRQPTVCTVLLAKGGHLDSILGVKGTTE